MIPYKTFGRILDLAIQASKGDIIADIELCKLQETFKWPRDMSPEQRKEWADLHERLDPKTPAQKEEYANAD